MERAQRNNAIETLYVYTRRRGFNEIYNSLCIRTVEGKGGLLDLLKTNSPVTFKRVTTVRNWDGANGAGYTECTENDKRSGNNYRSA